MNKSVRITLVTLLCVAGMAACTKKEVKPAPPPPPPPPKAQPAPPPQPTGFMPADLDTNSCLRQRTVYFDFDKSEIKPQYEQIMQCHAKYLQDRPDARVRLTGNTDERGTREYNLGLGERRGNAVAAALEADGASADQITVVSYGEERPVCREHTEACWAKNRRVEIEYTVK
ncbi:peptidoglycan-associated lipoprotein Pal [Oleiagrimonas sp.]|jgi:peptidoglycan-associated lipoprotein|uniref:peptidoglycan-associated lipoprotein Pal n=1 Tax=Oleiagrimonas sp. TaxID=2010330 RepID=UPI0026359D53|nr:peptidoglycan-associated lipoprotein Pal [Oleiagrimonas sp.]MDA3915169.1 peptidoglycan-associated lipoprotein Pal [Oleiagrimonas sp.]